MKQINLSLLVLFLALSLTSCREDNVEENPCKGRQWDNAGEYLNCKFPSPPHGRWHAVYTKEFAEKYNLPKENISKDLSPGFDYMEMDVQPYALNIEPHGHDLTACMVNMLVKRPNDIALYGGGNMSDVWEIPFHNRRKMLQLIDLEEHKSQLREIGSFGLSDRNYKYDPKAGYSIGSSIAFYGGVVLDEYDYISANASCYYLISREELFPDGWTFNYAKASVWGKEKYRFKRGFDPRRLKGKDFFDSVSYINIPSELVSTIYKDMPMGGY